MAERYLLLTTDLARGGTPAVVKAIATHLRAGVPGCKAMEVEVACLAADTPAGDFPVAHELRAAGVVVHALGAKSAWDVGVFGRVRGLIEERQYSAVLSLLVHANVAAALAARKLPAVRFHQSMQTAQLRPAWHLLAQRVAARYAMSVVVPSESVAAVARERCAVEAEKILVLPNGVNVGEFEFRRPGALGGKPRVGFLGRLDPIKRVGHLISAMPGLVKAGAALHVYGYGPEEAKLREQAASLLPAGTYEFHGAVGHPMVALRELDVLVLPSSSEGFGLVLIEAMAAGVAVVAADVPGVRDVVRDGETGLLYGSERQLAGTIQRVLGDEGLRRKLIMAGRAEVERKYDWKRLVGFYGRLMRGE